MTVNQLIKKLQKIQDKYGKRTHVCLNIDKLKQYDNDYSHRDIKNVSVESLLWEVEDSYFRTDGSERYKTIVNIE
jgi:hypothetical protein